MDAEAKYSSEKERTLAPRTVVLRFVVVANVVSMDSEGTGVTVMDEVLLGEAEVSVSWMVSGDRA